MALKFELVPPARLERAGRALLATLLGQGRYPLTHADLLPDRLPPTIAARTPRGGAVVRTAA